MALYTNAEMAQLCRSAIADLIKGKTRSYSIMGRSFTREDIGKLRTMEKGYLAGARRSSFGRSHFLDMS